MLDKQARQTWTVHREKESFVHRVCNKFRLAEKCIFRSARIEYPVDEITETDKDCKTNDQKQILSDSDESYRQRWKRKSQMDTIAWRIDTFI